MLPARQLNFGRSAPQGQHAQWQQQQQQHQQAQYGQPIHGLALPGGGNPYVAPNTLSLPGPSTFASPVKPQAVPPQPTLPVPSTNGAVASAPTPSAVPSTPAPLTLEQQHITAVEGIVPQLQNIVATVNLDCRLDLKTIALHARNAEYNPKVSLALLTS